MPFLPDIDILEVVFACVKLLLAALLALPVGLNRERSARSLGLRTFPLVSVAACAFVLVGQSVAGDDPGAQARIIQGLITGVGFLGAGAIIQRGTDVTGTATAAAIWSTAGLGACVAWGRFELALGLTVMNYIALKGLSAVSENLKGDNPDTIEDEDTG